MRAIINLSSERAAKAAGWKAKPVGISHKKVATFSETLKAAKLHDGNTLFDLLVEKGKLKSDWILYVNGLVVCGPSSLRKKIKDSSQIHILEQVPSPK